jgi:hypothetical protein
MLQDHLKVAKTRIDLTVHQASIRDESLIGADLGLVLKVATDDVQYQRSALLQAKRLHPTEEGFGPYCTYDLESVRSRKQADKMLEHNSASFFILYNPSSLAWFSRSSDSDNIDAVTSRMLSYWITYYDEMKGRFGESESHVVLPSRPPNILPFDPADRICVLRSDFVNASRPSSLRAKALHPYTQAFANFMVDDLIYGKVGDATKAGVAAASGRNRNFAVRYSLGLEVRSGRFFTGEALMPLFN